MAQTSRTADSTLRATTNPAFRFLVKVDKQAIGAFTECTLPSLEWEMLDVEEGGLNRYIHTLPGRRKKGTLTLKNGLGLGAELVQWYLDAMKSEQFRRKTVTVELLNGLAKPVMEWHIENCVPVKWVAPQLTSTSTSIAIQTLELACGEITWKPIKQP